MSYLPHKVPPTSQLFSSFRELPSAVRMADNPAYDGERKKRRKKTPKTYRPQWSFIKPKTISRNKKILFWLSSSDFSIPGEKGGGGGTTGFLSVGNISYN